jgi:hypothetical protein
MVRRNPVRRGRWLWMWRMLILVLLRKPKSVKNLAWRIQTEPVKVCGSLRQPSISRDPPPQSRMQVPKPDLVQPGLSVEAVTIEQGFPVEAGT